MRSSILQTQLADGRIRCDVCQWRCELQAGKTGRCGVRSHHDGAIIADADGLISGATIGPIEDHRFWHFFPDAQVLSIGSFGTPVVPANNASPKNPYAHPVAGARHLEPERVAQFAHDRLCRGIVLTFGDPAVSFEWALDCIKLGRAASRFTTITTSGYFNPEAFAMLAPYLDGMRLDIYGFSDQSYRTLTGFTDWRTIFKLAAEARQRWNIHIEVALHLVPGVNDSDGEVGALSKWHRVALGSLTPLHILSEQPAHDSVQRAIATALKAGARFVYGPAANQTTECPNCLEVAVVRGDGPTQQPGVADDVCQGCGTSLGLRTSLFRRNVRYEMAT